MLKELLIALGLSASPMESAPVTCMHDCAITEQGQNLIKSFEGYYPYIYKDVAGYDTVGYGHLVKSGEKIMTPLMGEDAEALFQSDLKPAVKAINRNVRVPLFEAQVDSLGSWIFNLGEGALRSSTLLKRVNAARHDDVPLELIRWVYAGGVKVKGLLRRREAEAALYRAKYY